MKTKDFLKKHEACIAGAKWALSISDDMADVWDAMIKQNRHDWLLWVAIQPGVFSDSVLRKLACRFVRETPLLDGRKVWDLLTDERSRKAVEMAERYADGKATESELASARADAYDAAYGDADADAAQGAAAYAAYAAASYDADYAARAAALAAARAVGYVARAAADARAAAHAAQVRMVAELGNPFKEELVNQ